MPKQPLADKLRNNCSENSHKFPLNFLQPSVSYIKLQIEAKSFKPITLQK